MIVSGKKYKNLLEKYGIVLDRLTDKIHERDRLAAENAELRWKAKESELAMMEAQQGEDFANATLDALLDALQEVVSCDSEELPCKKLLQIQAILDPQPKETTHDDE